MDRGAWQATIHGVARVRHDLATKPPPNPRNRKFLRLSVRKRKQYKLEEVSRVNMSSISDH